MIKNRATGENSAALVEVTGDIGVKSTHFGDLGQLLEWMRTAAADTKIRFKLNWNNHFVYAAEENIVLTEAQCDILKELPFGVGSNGVMFKIPRPASGKFNADQLLLLRIAGAPLLTVSASKEFSEKTRQAEALAAAGEEAEVQFTKGADGKSIEVPADSIVNLRRLWNPKIKVIPGNGEVNAVVSRHPTEPFVINSLWGLNGKVAVNVVLEYAGKTVDGEGKPINPVAGKPATVFNDSTAYLLNTLATSDETLGSGKGKQPGTYVANVKNRNGKLDNPIVACYGRAGFRGNMERNATVDNIEPVSFDLTEVHAGTYRNENGGWYMIKESQNQIDKLSLGDQHYKITPIRKKTGNTIQITLRLSNGAEFVNKTQYIQLHPGNPATIEEDYFHALNYANLTEFMQLALGLNPGEGYLQSIGESPDGNRYRMVIMNDSFYNIQFVGNAPFSFSNSETLEYALSHRLSGYSVDFQTALDAPGRRAVYVEASYFKGTQQNFR
jgi:hypothetical protein